MRENRPYGSEGGVGESRSRPLSEWSIRGTTLMRQRIGANLEMDSHGLSSLAAFDQPRRAVAAR